MFAVIITPLILPKMSLLLTKTKLQSKPNSHKSSRMTALPLLELSMVQEKMVERICRRCVVTTLRRKVKLLIGKL